MFRNNKKQLFRWISKSLSREIPSGTVGFHFNLYESEKTIHIQLFGMSSYENGDDPETDYWPGSETFSTEEDIYEYPIKKLGSGWQEWLDSIISLLKEYIINGDRAAILKSTSIIGAGFVDGDMHQIWTSNDT